MDPFTWLLREMWALLEAKSTFTNAVAENNRIKLFGQNARRPEKDSMMEKDVPEVMIYPGGASYWNNRDSSGASINRMFSIQITSGDRLVDTGKFYEVEWAISRAMYDYDSLLKKDYIDPSTELTEQPVKRIDIPSAEEGLNDAELNRDLKGWTAVWQADVTMWFSYQILKGG